MIDIQITGHACQPRFVTVPFQQGSGGGGDDGANFIIRSVG
jgi:hypothetical protein